MLVISKFLTIISVLAGLVHRSFGYCEHFNGLVGFPVVTDPCGNTDDRSTFLETSTGLPIDGKVVSETDITNIFLSPQA